jgi:D-alanyl-D-alanine carboxypeptidase
VKKVFLVFILVLLSTKISTVYAVSTSATSAILMDMDGGRILYAEDIHNQRSVASISKVMTAIVSIENKNIEDKVTIGEEIKTAYGSGIYIKQGEELTMKDLLYGLMLRSGNDAALAIAHHTSGSVDKFVLKMNEKAKQIGMTNSQFNNPSGLDQEKGNYSTAYDMALLMKYAYQNETFKTIMGTKQYQLTTNKNVYRWTNKNKLLTMYKYTTGGKTGFTEKARRTLITTASKDGLNLVVVTLNDGNDWQDHMNLFDYGFATYKAYELIKEGNIQIYDEVYYEDYDLYVKEPFKYALTEEEREQIILKFELEKARIIENDSVVGKVKIFLGDEEIGVRDIFVREKEIEQKKSNFQKLIEWFKKLW